MKITDHQVAAACAVASRVFDGGLKATQGVEVLTSQYGLNAATANDFINDYRYLLRGKVFHRAMSASAMHYFMAHIFAERDDAARGNAVTALRAHIAYYEDHYRTTMHSMRAVADHFDGLRKTPADADRLQAEFLAAVEKAMRDPRRDRLRRLEAAGKRPRSIIVQSTVFVRNPDVVAETLLRAQGRCEACKADAPFERAKDGTPYLEVHHRVRLANGGDDCTSNTVALCPNCHRRFHYGKAGA